MNHAEVDKKTILFINKYREEVLNPGHSEP